MNPATLPNKAEGGWSLIETALAGTLLAVALLTVASAMSSSVTTMNGNVFFDQPVAADSRFRIELSVTTTAVDLLEVRAVLREQRSGREITRVATHRSRR